MISCLEGSHTQTSHFSFIYRCLFAGIVFSIAVFLFLPGISFAAEEDFSDAVIEDAIIDHEDLGVEAPTVLPDQKVRYGFKRFGRFFQKTLATGEKKQELIEQFANQELADASLLLEQKNTEGRAVNAAVKAIKRAQKQLENVEVKNPEAAGKFLGHEVVRQKVYDRVQRQLLDHAPADVIDDAFESIVNAKKEAAEYAAQTLGSIEDQEGLLEEVGLVLEDAKGSSLNAFKQAEALQFFEDHASKNRRDFFDKAKKRTLERFAENIHDEFVGGNRDIVDRFEQYAKEIPGDETIHLEIFDTLKTGLEEYDFPEEVRGKIEQWKDISARRHEQDAERAEDRFGDDIAHKIYERRLERFSDLGKEEVDVSRFRVLEELRTRTSGEEGRVHAVVQAEHKKMAAKFKAQFTDEGSQKLADKFLELSKNPDPTSFAIIKEIEKQLTPEQRKFVDALDQQLKHELVQQRAEHGALFEDKFFSNLPEHQDILQGLERDFRDHREDFLGPADLFASFDGQEPLPFVQRPGQLDQFFQKASFDQQVRIRRELESIDDPEAFDHFQGKFEGFENIPPEFQFLQGTFDVKRRQIEERRLQDKEEEHSRDTEQAFEVLEEEYRQKIEGVLEKDREAFERQFNEKRNNLKERELKNRQELFEERIGDRSSFDPFCDERCQKEEELFIRQRFEQNIDNDRRRFEEDQDFFRLERESLGDFNRLSDQDNALFETRKRDGTEGPIVDRHQIINIRKSPSSSRGRLDQRDSDRHLNSEFEPPRDFSNLPSKSELERRGEFKQPTVEDRRDEFKQPRFEDRRDEFKPKEPLSNGDTRSKVDFNLPVNPPKFEHNTTENKDLFEREKLEDVNRPDFGDSFKGF
ncbi:MAG: hypothetical protein HN726_01985 [Candidatus Magasanikbacteria bacterium]|nr:hypothetical protein [Candidatus Magasanikbacteria bacterium]